VSPVKYELGFYIPEDAILHSDRRENLKSYISQDKCRKSTFITSQTLPSTSLLIHRQSSVSLPFHSMSLLYRVSVTT
jgi:hypothetical protein